MKKIRIEIPTDEYNADYLLEEIKLEFKKIKVLSGLEDVVFEVIETPDVVPVDEIENTDWAKAFLRDNSRDYQEALGYMQRRVDVWIDHNDTDRWCVAVNNSDYDFWLGAFDTEQKAQDFCHRFCLNIVQY